MSEKGGSPKNGNSFLLVSQKNFQIRHGHGSLFGLEGERAQGGPDKSALLRVARLFLAWCPAFSGKLTGTPISILGAYVKNDAPVKLRKPGEPIQSGDLKRERGTPVLTNRSFLIRAQH